MNVFHLTTAFKALELSRKRQKRSAALAMSSPSLIPCVALFRQILSSSITGCHFHSSTPTIASQGPVHEEFVKRLLNRRWMLPTLETKVHQVKLLVNPKTKNDKRRFGDIRFFNNPYPCLLGGEDAAADADGKGKSFYVVRDDLLHPLINGNKARKLDALLPLLEQHGITDVVTCGGCQSAHTAAVGVTCAERGLNSHLLLRDIHKKVVIVNEGAGDGVALLGVIRLVNHLSGTNLFGTKKPMKLVVDAGTGTTALGLALGAICLGLPWEVTAIMLADSMDGYRKKEKELISDFKRQFGLPATDSVLDKIDGGIVQWVERGYPRKFGNVLEGEVEACQQVAQQTGISVDPVYTLAAWELAMHLSQISNDATEVVMLHTGGTLGMFGLAQRYKSSFNNLKTN